MKTNIIHNKALNRFEIAKDGLTAIIEYRIEDGRMIFPHTYVPTELEGQGIASALAKAALNYALENQLKIVPLCSFVRVYIQRHPEYQTT